MRTAVLDFYDDMGATLQQLIPSQGQIPDFVKTASAIPRDAHHNNFAVVMVDQGNTIPRFPISDAGNAWLSSVYFHANHEDLPGEAQKTAAVMIKKAMEHFGLPVLDTIQKIAEDEDVQSNVVNISGKRPAAVIRPTMQDDEAREDAQYALERADGTKVYPLNDAETAKTAADYFDTHKHDFTMRERREFAVKTAAALDQAGLPVNESVASYAAPGFSPMIRSFIDVRHAYLMDMNDPEAAALLQKVAAERGTVDPETFAQNLETFDRDVGLDKAWNSHIPDPWYSTFFSYPGMWKKASTKVLTAGVESVLEEDLVALATDHKDVVEKSMGPKVSQALCKNPCAVFESMPTPQKIVLARLANEVKA